MLSIALVHEWLDSWGGAEEVLLALHELYPEAPIYTSVLRRDKVKPLENAQIITSSIQKLPFAKYKKQLFFPLMPYVFEQFDLSKYDVVISSSYGAAKGVLTSPDQLHLCYCHTPTRFLWMPHIDKRLPWGLIPRIMASNLRIWDAQAAQRPDVFVANCKNTQDNIAKYYRRESTVIYPPIQTAKFVPAKEKDDGYYLTTSRLVAQKRIDLIILAFRGSKKRLIIAGTGPEEIGLKKMAQGSRNIEFLGFVSQTQKIDLFQKCHAFIFMAEEDFGMVPLEAMAAGKPVLAYGKGGATETVIDGKTGILFPEQTPQALLKAMDDLEKISISPKTCTARAEEFDVSVFKRKISQKVEELLSARYSPAKKD